MALPTLRDRHCDSLPAGPHGASPEFDMNPFRLPATQWPHIAWSRASKASGASLQARANGESRRLCPFRLESGRPRLIVRPKCPCRLITRPGGTLEGLREEIPRLLWSHRAPHKSFLACAHHHHHHHQIAFVASEREAPPSSNLNGWRAWRHSVVRIAISIDFPQSSKKRQIYFWVTCGSSEGSDAVGTSPQTRSHTKAEKA